MEYWNGGLRLVEPTARRERLNIGFQKDISNYNFIANPFGGGAINPTLHYPRTHYSTIPVFHHSNRERSELSSKEDKAMIEEDSADMNPVVKRSGELFESGLY